MWRHGDRTPTKTFKNDPIQEANWTMGGSGFGQLTPLGMQQQMKLGKLIRKTYVDDHKFLSPQYSSKEIYVRATDTNRTIVSAMSNMVGMYGQKDFGHKPNVDYPNATAWPAQYVPIAVHTMHKPTDYVGFDLTSVSSVAQATCALIHIAQIVHILNLYLQSDSLEEISGYVDGYRKPQKT
ncbi:unnamed protein product [Strongylus vulgaris]|uniref:acid phosphatase n=1 Tax=Strongylus vulgaris TaxID=40348 RepID=A0A3P7IND9_STRVU|nr:unnamed protein product [Strongylus vulgaris]